MNKKLTHINILLNADGESHILNMHEGDRKADFYQTIQLSDFQLELVVNLTLDSEEIDQQLKAFNYNEKVVTRGIFKTFKALNNSSLKKMLSVSSFQNMCWAFLSIENLIADAVAQRKAFSFTNVSGKQFWMN